MVSKSGSRSVPTAMVAFSTLRIASFLLVARHYVAHRVTRFDLSLSSTFYPEEQIAIHTPIGQLNPPMLYVFVFSCLILVDSVLIVVLISQGAIALKRLLAASWSR